MTKAIWYQTREHNCDDYDLDTMPCDSDCDGGKLVWRVRYEQAEAKHE